MNASLAQMPSRIEERIAEEALRAALLDLSWPGSWRGVVRGLAWRLVSSEGRDPHAIAPMADAAEAMLGSLIDDTLWAVEQTVRRTLAEYRRVRPEDRGGALAAARLDAREESAALLVSACERVLDTLRSANQRAA